MITFDATGLSVAEQRRDGDVAEVSLSGMLVEAIDPVRYETAYRAAVAARGEAVDQGLLDQVLNLIDGGHYALPVDQTVRVVRQRWHLAGVRAGPDTLSCGVVPDETDVVPLHSGRHRVSPCASRPAASSDYRRLAPTDSRHHAEFVTKPSISHRTVSGLLVVAAAIGLSGCDMFTSDAHRAGFYLINRTSDPIDVTYLHEDKRITIANDLTPGNSLMVNRFVNGGQCVNESMVATDQAGGVIATFPGPICDQTEWEISANEPAP